MQHILFSRSFQTYLKNSSLYFREPAENELLVFYFFSIYCLFVRLCLCAWKTWTRTRSFVSWNNAKTRRLSKRIERWGPFDSQIQQHIDWPNSNFNHKVSWNFLFSQVQSFCRINLFFLVDFFSQMISIIYLFTHWLHLQEEIKSEKKKQIAISFCFANVV